MRIHHWSQYQKCSARDSQCLLGLRRLQAKFRCQQFLQLVEQKCPDSPVFGRLLGGQNRVPGRPHHKAFRAGRTSGCAWDRDDIGMTLENGDAAMLNFSPSQMPLLSITSWLIKRGDFQYQSCNFGISNFVPLGHMFFKNPPPKSE